MKYLMNTKPESDLEKREAVTRNKAAQIQLEKEIEKNEKATAVQSIVTKRETMRI